MQFKVLIVEDDEDTATIGAISLRKLGFDVQIVTNGNDAIPTMKSWNPHVVILDLELPGKNGLQILQEMFFDRELKNLIIVANTVHMDAKDDLGFAYYAHYQRVKNEEPVMINKMGKDEGKHLDLAFVVTNMIGQKYGALPQNLVDWLKKHDDSAKKWDVV